MSLLSPNTILVYSNGELLGDAILKLPFVQGLARLFPAARRVWMSGQGNTAFFSTLRPLVAHCLDEIYNDTHIGARWLDRWRQPWKNYISHPSFDLVIDLQRKLRPTCVVKKIPHRMFLSETLDWRLSTFKPAPPYQRPLHRTQQVMAFLSLLTSQPLSLYPTLDIPKEFIQMAQALLAKASCPLILAPGAGNQRSKCWPLPFFIQLAEKCLAHHRTPVFILGPDEAQWTRELREKLPKALFPLQETSITSPYLTIALGRLSTLAIANDTGSGHLLGLSQRPLISLFGPTEPQEWAACTPFLTLIKAQDFGCGHAMNQIPVTAVWEAVQHQASRQEKVKTLSS